MIILYKRQSHLKGENTSTAQKLEFFKYNKVIVRSH